MVNLIRIPSFAYCVLHTIVHYLTASWSRWTANCWNYAASASLAPKLARITLDSSFNLVCPLITENSSRTRNPDIPITTSKPWHPLVIYSLGKLDGSARKPACITHVTRHRFLDSTFFVFTQKVCPLHSPCGRQNRGIPLIIIIVLRVIFIFTPALSKCVLSV